MREDPPPENIERCFVQFLEFALVHAGERNAARVFFQRAVRKLYGVIVAGFNDDPRPVSIERFANTD